MCFKSLLNKCTGGITMDSAPRCHFWDRIFFQKTHLSDFLQILAVVGSPQHIDRESDSVEYKMQTRDFEQTRFPLGAF